MSGRMVVVIEAVMVKVIGMIPVFVTVKVTAIVKNILVVIVSWTSQQLPW